MTEQALAHVGMSERELGGLLRTLASEKNHMGFEKHVKSLIQFMKKM